MNEKWPPPGHQAIVQMTANLEDPPLSYTVEITVPRAQAEAGIDLATVRLGRLGGPNASDESFRAALHQQVGAVTVAGGHAETAMKRVVLVAQAKDQSVKDVDLNWTDLVKKLRTVSRKDHPVATRLGAILDWADKNDVKKRRDDVVHAYWWDYAGVDATRSRFTRDGQSFMVRGSIERLAEDANLIFEYARRLDELVVSDWPQGRLLSDAVPKEDLAFYRETP